MLSLDPESVDHATLRSLWSGAPASLNEASMQRVAAAAASVERIVASGETVYGINTGFGLLANTRIPDDRLVELQRNLILSHSAGLGEPLPRHVTRLMILLKLLGLGRGFSGVRPAIVEALQGLLDRDAMPVIPSQGSVGASGDLAPLAHLIAALAWVPLISASPSFGASSSGSSPSFCSAAAAGITTPARSMEP